MMAAQMGRRKIKFKRKEEPAPEPESQPPSEPRALQGDLDQISPPVPEIRNTPKEIVYTKHLCDVHETYAVRQNGNFVKHFNTHNEAQDYARQLDMYIKEEIEKQITEEEMEELGKCLEDNFFRDQHWM